MGPKKIKKQKQQESQPAQQLEDVGEERAFEVEYDEETNEVVFVHHYRRFWGDPMDADTEHGLTLEENQSLINSLMEILEVQKRVVMQNVGTVMEIKSTPIAEEGNPATGPKLPRTDIGEEKGEEK